MPNLRRWADTGPTVRSWSMTLRQPVLATPAPGLSPPTRARPTKGSVVVSGVSLGDAGLNARLRLEHSLPAGLSLSPYSAALGLVEGLHIAATVARQDLKAGVVPNRL